MRTHLAWLVALAAATACAAGPSGGSGTRSGAAADRQRGIALPAWDTDAYQRPEAARYLRAIKATGADWVQFNPTWYQRSADDDGPHRTDETTTDAGLRHIIGLARDAGLKVLLKPHIDLPGDADRATIRPARPDRWFDAYREFLGHYADLARGSGAQALAVGTELAGVSDRTRDWTAVIAEIRDRFHGQLVYAANYDEYSRIAFWNKLDLIGVDAYWPLSTAPTTDQEKLRRAWRPITTDLARFSARYGRRILFTEAGYTSQRGSTTAPYEWTISRQEDAREQAAAYEALLEELGDQRWWAGVHWWMWDDWPDSGEVPRKLAYTPHGKPAEDVLRRYWRD